MILPDEGTSPAEIAMWYRDIPMTPDELKTLEGRVTAECFKYLIGRMCGRERKRNCGERAYVVYERVGQALGYAQRSVKRFALYAVAIDRLLGIAPDVATDILSGRTRFSLVNTPTLARLDPAAIQAVVARAAAEKTSITNLLIEQRKLRKKTKRRGSPLRIMAELPKVSVKDIPAYDPDAQIVALAYTIPSWASAADRTFNATDFSQTSPAARRLLTSELIKLNAAIDAIISRIAEECDGQL